MIKIKDKLSIIDEYWSPKILTELNGQHVKLAKIKGEFIWHHHEEEDELFYVLDGELTIEFRDKTVVLHPGEMITIPRGVEHKPIADEEVHILLFEPASTVNTGQHVNEMTKTQLNKI